MKFLAILMAGMMAFAFQSGEMFELDVELNARWDSKNFKKEHKANIKAVLPKGTKGVVQEVIQLRKGAQGVKIKVTSEGKFKDQEYWVYNNPASPFLIKVAGNQNETREPADEAGEVGKLKKDQWARKDQDQDQMQDMIRGMDGASKKINDQISPQDCKDCEVADAGRGEKQEPVAPLVDFINQDEDHENITSSVCRFAMEGVDVCSHTREDGSQSENSFVISNKGGNPTFAPSEYYTQRAFEFNYSGKARQNLNLTVFDGVDDTTSHSNWSIMMFFPRKVLPSVKKNGNTLDVTLATGEVVKFDAKTREIINSAKVAGSCAAVNDKSKVESVLCEEPMSVCKKAGGCDTAFGKRKMDVAQPLGLKYTGSGIMIKTDSTVLPIGDNRARPVEVTRYVNGVLHSCKVQTTELWVNKKGGDENTDFKYSRDEEFYKFLKSKKACAGLVSKPLE